VHQFTSCIYAGGDECGVTALELQLESLDIESTALSDSESSTAGQGQASGFQAKKTSPGDRRGFLFMQWD